MQTKNFLINGTSGNLSVPSGCVFRLRKIAYKIIERNRQRPVKNLSFYVFLFYTHVYALLHTQAYECKSAYRDGTVKN